MTSRLLSLIVGCLTIGSAASFAGAATPRVDGIVNFRQVNDRIYRGAQPDDAAWPALAKMGVKTVIDLRREVEHSVAAEKRMVEAAGMKYVNFPMNGFDTPTSDQMMKVLAVIEALPGVRAAAAGPYAWDAIAARSLSGSIPGMASARRCSSGASTDESSVLSVQIQARTPAASQVSTSRASSEWMPAVSP